jgi:hypothetical protein
MYYFLIGIFIKKILILLVLTASNLGADLRRVLFQLVFFIYLTHVLILFLGFLKTNSKHPLYSIQMVNNLIS